MFSRENVQLAFKLSTALAVGSYVYLWLSPVAKGK